MANFGDRVRQMRLKAGISQEELATRMGYRNKSTITKIEQGKRDIPQNKIVKFAEVLGTTPGVLMGWVDEQTGNETAAIASIVAKLQKDKDLLSMMTIISELDAEKRQAVMTVLNALSITGK